MQRYGRRCWLRQRWRPAIRSAAKSPAPHLIGAEKWSPCQPFGKATIFNQLQRHSRLVAPAGCTDWQLYLLTYDTQTQMHRRSTQGRGGPPQPGPPHPGRPQPGPPQPRPPCQPPPCQPPPPPCQPANCAWWTTPEAAGGVGAAFATPARPMAEKLSAPATAPAPTILFRIMPIPSLIWNSWLENLPGWYIVDDR